MLRADCLRRMKAAQLCGTLLLAPEGMNATIAGSAEATEQFITHLRRQPGFEAMKAQESWYDAPPFGKAMVKIREEIISLGQPAHPANICGTHVAPEAWNAVIAAPDVLLIDGRNSYEARLGKFAGAVDMGAEDFKDFPALLAQYVDPARHKKIAMYCTGGIRCEKLSSYALSQGIEKVYQLEGGILHYLEQIPASESTWEGSCYVFDERVAVGHGVQPESSSFCPACGHPASAEDWQHPLFYPGISCQHCA